MRISAIKKKLRQLAKPERAARLRQFFKTAPGDYAEKDKFIGVYVPDLRKLAKEYLGLSFDELSGLLESAIHEERLLALLILVLKFKKVDQKERRCIFHYYVKNTSCINNWDLVDQSAHHIVGAYLIGEIKAGKSINILYKLAKSRKLWGRRIAMVACWQFIRDHKHGDLNVVLEIAELLLNDKHDLIHKAVGWMLRELGKRDIVMLEGFLDQYAGAMPRTMLRYAIEKLPQPKKRFFLRN
jgi:3-methyladenine DNA glycosylase AlkD